MQVRVEVVLQPAEPDRIWQTNGVEDFYNCWVYQHKNISRPLLKTGSSVLSKTDSVSPQIEARTD